jgi:hypothetical protein
MEAYDCFATSSFDCCVYIWDTTKENVLLGSLMLGNDNSWQLGSRLLNTIRERRKQRYLNAVECLKEVKSVTPQEFLAKFDFDDSKHLEEDNPVLTKMTRRKINNAKSRGEKILMKANALRALHKDR